MVHCKYAARDVGGRLDSTICRYDKVPYFVRVRNDGDALDLYSLDNIAGKPVKRIDPYDTKFDISSVPLGYVQVDKQVVYVSRRPLRKYKQGVDTRGVTIDYLPDLPHQKYNPDHVLYSTGFINSVTGKFPTLDAALTRLRSPDIDNAALAISRNIAMYVMKHKVINVYFKNELVGWIGPTGKIVHVPSDDMGWIVSVHLQGFNWEID